MNCPMCQSEYSYQDGALWICPDCSHEWSDQGEKLGNTFNQSMNEQEAVVKDANGVILLNGDTVSVVRDLKVKGSSSVIKSGTKVKNIKILEASEVHDGHNIFCRIEGHGAMNLKSEVVKKVN